VVSDQPPEAAAPIDEATAIGTQVDDVTDAGEVESGAVPPAVKPAQAISRVPAIRPSSGAAAPSSVLPTLSAAAASRAAAAEAWPIPARTPETEVAVEPMPVVGEGLLAGVWGPAIAVILAGSVGIADVAISFSASRAGAPWAVYTFWLGLLILFVPVAIRVLGSSASGRERAVLVTFLALGLYFVKLLHSPVSLDFHDELQHWRTAADIIDTGRLFGENPLLLTSPLFPGLEIVTGALAGVTGAPIDPVGVVVVGLARIVLVLCLFGTYERLSGSARVAGIGTLVYLANPSVLYFDAQFAYESLALAFAASTLLLLVIREDGRQRRHDRLTIAAAGTLFALVLSHHLTSYVFTAFLIAWALSQFVRGRRETGCSNRPVLGVAGMAAIGTVLTIGWLAFVATVTIGYLATPVGGAVASLIRTLLQEERSRELFESATTTGIVAPPWERVMGFASAGLVAALLPIGAWRIWAGTAAAGRGIAARLASLDPLVILLVILSFGYPLTLILRLSHGGAEVASRAAPVFFVAVAFVVAAAIASWPLVGRRAWRLPAMLAVLSVILVGNVVVGWPPWQRLPGPYLVGADSRSITEEGRLAADWAREILGPGSAMGADRTNTLLLGSYGRQHVISYQTSRVDLSPVFFSDSIGPDEIDIIRRSGVEFLVVDLRLASDLPQLGIYYDAAEVRDGPHTSPIPLSALEKFDDVPGIGRIYDSGNIRVYDLRGLPDV